jgi:hypothetical protein
MIRRIGQISQPDVMDFLKAECLFDASDLESKVKYQKISEVLFPSHFHAIADNGLEKDDEHVKDLK